MQFQIEPRLKAVNPALDSPPTPPKAQKPSPPKPDEMFVEDARASGLLDAFEEAVKAVLPLNGLPSDMGEFLVTFFRTYGVKNVPQFVVNRYAAEFGGRIEFWSAQRIVAVLADRIVRAFVPLDYLVGAPTKHLGSGSEGARLMASPAKLEAWVRGKHGYVPLESKVFGQAMRERSRGDFARLVQ